MRTIWTITFSIVLIITWIVYGSAAWSQVAPSAPRAAKSAFRIGKDEISLDQLMLNHSSDFYEIEQKKFDLVEKLAQETYLSQYWSRLAEKGNVSAEQARQKYLRDRISLTEPEIQGAIQRLRRHPNIEALKESDRRARAVEYLESVKSREIIRQLLSQAQVSKDFAILYPKPAQPTFNMEMFDKEPNRYGAQADDNKPISCVGVECVTIVEFAEYQCPFSKKAQAMVNQLLVEYRGRVRFITRDFPLGFHGRSRPASVAAQCSGKQGKFWAMHDLLFENQRALSDGDLQGYARSLGLDMARYQQCTSAGTEANALIDRNYASGERMGVNSTPVYFVNGHRVIGQQATLDDLRKAVVGELSKVSKFQEK